MKTAVTKIIAKWLIATLTVVIFVSSAHAAREEKPQREGTPKHRAQASAYAGALEKTGFFNGFDGDYVKLIEEGNYRKQRYLVKDDVLILLNDQPIERVRILIHSIVKMTIVEGVVVEIVLVEESS